METNLTKEERNKALQRLYGKAPGVAAALIIFLVIEVIGVVGMILLMPLMNLSQDPVLAIVMCIFLLLYGLLIVWMGLMVADYFKHSKYLKEKYEALPGWRKEKLLYLAHNYDKRDGICIEEDYIYGIMSEAKRGKENHPHVVVFLYIDIKELAWAYRVENYTAVSTTNSVGSQTYYSRENKMRFITESGSCFQGKSGKTDEQGLLQMIQKRNPKCRLGYKKEWEKEWKKG